MKSKVGSTQKVLNVWAIILILWSFYRITFRADLPIWFDELIAKPIVFLFPIYWFIIRVEKKSFLKGVGFSQKNVLTEIAFGLGIGCLFISIAVVARILKELPFSPLVISFTSGTWALSTIAAAGSEQILSTGFVFKRLSEESKNIVSPLIISALLFFVIHIPILFGADKISVSILVQMIVLNTILSLTTSIVFLLRKNTIAPIVVHALYLLSLPILL